MVSFSLSAFLVATAAVTATASTTANRRLSYALIAGYEPGSSVTDHNAIDLDQAAMEELLALGTSDSFDNALAIYTQGAYSKSVADVTFAQPIGTDISKGDAIVGTDKDGNQVIGKAYADYTSAATSMLIQYKTSDNQSTYVTCQVGASQNPNMDGCFAASGEVTITSNGNDITASYTYDPLTNNINKRTIQGFSTGAEGKMGTCETCPYPTFQKFFDYYGSYDYANQLVLAAFAGSKTNFENFNNDFGLYDYEGKSEIIKKGTAYMHIWMYVIREMEDALDDCQEGCIIDNCNDDPVHAWDEGVAFYTGSLEGAEYGGSGSGKLLYALADKRCSNYKTCGDMGDDVTGTSHINMEIFRQFGIGQSNLRKGECASAREQKEAIEILMLVPLIQGTLRYAFKTQAGEAYSEKAEAEGVIFAASVLPAVHACDPTAAQVIADNLVAGQSNTADFVAVKAAFESTYECMGVNPEHVGGLYNAATRSYEENAEPLNYSGSSAVVATASMVVATVVGALIAIVV